MKKEISRVILYLGYILILFAGLFTIVTIDVFNGNITINFVKILNFIDLYNALIILAFSFLVICISGLFFPFKKAFSLILNKQQYSHEEHAKSSLAVRAFMVSAIIGGIISAIIQCITMQSSMEVYTGVGIYISLAFLSIFYSLLICALLLPVYIYLKKDVIDEKYKTLK